LLLINSNKHALSSTFKIFLKDRKKSALKFGNGKGVMRIAEKPAKAIHQFHMPLWFVSPCYLLHQCKPGPIIGRILFAKSVLRA